MSACVWYYRVNQNSVLSYSGLDIRTRLLWIWCEWDAANQLVRSKQVIHCHPNWAHHSLTLISDSPCINLHKNFFERILWFHVVRWMSSELRVGKMLSRCCNAIIQTLRLKHGRVVIDVLNEDCNRQVGGGAVSPVTGQTEPNTNKYCHGAVITQFYLMKCVGLLWSVKCSRDFARTTATCLLSTSRNVKNPSARDWK